MKRRLKAGSVDLVGPELIQLILAPKSHQGRKRKSGEEERRRSEKIKAMVELLVFVMATMMASFGLKKKNCRQNHSFDQGHGLTTSSIY